jgi:ABC-type uncharacterized transport system substrate-binding protein
MGLCTQRSQPLVPYEDKAQGAAQALALTLASVEVRGVADVERAVKALSTEPADVLCVIQDHLLFSHRTRIVALAALSRLPVTYMHAYPRATPGCWRA